MIEIGIGLLIIAIGSFGQSSSYVPINKIRDWSWESFCGVYPASAYLRLVGFPLSRGDVGGTGREYLAGAMVFAG